jgi:serine phosphatase RsbU (regulator of sigma subunit)
MMNHEKHDGDAGSPDSEVPRARILIVDDEPGIQRSAQRILSRRHQVTLASSGAEALEVLSREPQDLAIVDVRMPGMDGFEVLRVIKTDYHDTEVIIMTGSISNPEEKLVEALRERAFYFIGKPFEKAVLETIVDRCLQRQQLERTNRSHVALLETDLEKARTFQRLLLPSSFPRIPGVRGDVSYQPSERLGGDFYDFFRLAELRLGVLIADVAGHGVQAALFTGMLKSEMRAVFDDAETPERLFQRINDRLAPVMRNQYITAVLAILDFEAHQMRYVSAGHPAFFSGSGLAYESTGTPLGMIAGWKYESRQVALRPSDRLFLYTDGLSESQRPDGEEFGEDRLRDAFLATRPGAPDKALEHIIAASRAFARHDDFEDDATAMVIEFETF